MLQVEIRAVYDKNDLIYGDRVGVGGYWNFYTSLGNVDDYKQNRNWLGLVGI